MKKAVYFILAGLLALTLTRLAVAQTVQPGDVMGEETVEFEGKTYKKFVPEEMNEEEMMNAEEYGDMDEGSMDEDMGEDMGEMDDMPMNAEEK